MVVVNPSSLQGEATKAEVKAAQKAAEAAAKAEVGALQKAGVNPIGPAGGDLSGTYPNPTLQNKGKANGPALLNGQGSLLSAAPGTQNTPVGAGALENNTAAFNTAVGNLALNANTTGEKQVAFGTEALRKNSTGKDNTALGYAALASNTTGIGNTAVGKTALTSNTTGFANTAVGWDVLVGSSTGERNVGVGYEALVSSKTAGENTAVGYAALAENATGGRNVAIGTSALGTNSGGTNEGAAAKNVAIGVGAGEKNNGEANVFIGFQAAENELGSNLLYIANSNTATPLLKGNFEAKTLLINGTLAANGLLVEAPTALLEKAEATEFEPSTQKPTLVCGYFEGETLTRSEIRIKVGGTTVVQASISAANTGTNKSSFCFLVPRATKWKWEKVEGTVKVLKASNAVIG